MQFKKIKTSNGCCGSQKKNILYELDQPIFHKMINDFIQLGFNEHRNFSKTGILYITNDAFTITAPIGSNRLQVNCKIKECDEKIKELDQMLLNM